MIFVDGGFVGIGGDDSMYFYLDSPLWGGFAFSDSYQLHIDSDENVGINNGLIPDATYTFITTCPYCGFKTPKDKQYCGQDMIHGCGAALE